MNTHMFTKTRPLWVGWQFLRNLQGCEVITRGW